MLGSFEPRVRGPQPELVRQLQIRETGRLRPRRRGGVFQGRNELGRLRTKRDIATNGDIANE